MIMTSPLFVLPSYAVGFTNAGELPDRNSCDINTGSYPSQRMCWHSSGGYLDSGWRCGTSTSVGSGWDRRIYHRFATASPTPSRTTTATNSRVSSAKLQIALCWVPGQRLRSGCHGESSVNASQAAVQADQL